MSQALLGKAVAEVVAEFRRENGISPTMEHAVLHSSQRIVESAYRTALRIKEEMPDPPIPVARPPKIPSGLDAGARAELEQLTQELVADDARRSANRHTALLVTYRDLVTTLFRKMGVTDRTASELTEEIFTQ